MSVSLADRINGCLLGGALGDAMGGHFEGGDPPDGVFVPEQLRITDDTQLTIATCEAILESRRVIPEYVANHFVRWFRERRLTGLGSSTLKALTELDAGGHWALVGATGERASGSGAAMRVAPLAFMLDPDLEEDRQTIRDVCRITHRNDEAYIGGLAIIRTLRHLVSGGMLRADVLAMLVETLPDSRVRDRLAELRKPLPSIREYAEQFGTTGYVVDAVPMAVLAAVQSRDVLGTIEQIIRCGGDTDTIAALYGQLVGASHGTQALPMEIVEQIDAVVMIRSVAGRLAGVVGT